MSLETKVQTVWTSEPQDRERSFKLLRTILQNIIQNPTAKKYHKLKVSSVRSKLTATGALELLLAAGFVEGETHFTVSGEDLWDKANLVYDAIEAEETRRKTAETKLKKLDGITVNCFIEYNHTRSPFGIQPRCRFGRMKEVIGNALCLKNVRAYLQKSKTITSTKVELTDENKFLVEDYDVQNGDLIFITGDSNTEQKNPSFEYDMITIGWEDENKKLISNDVKISLSCTVQIMLDMIKQSRLYVPDSISIWFQGKELKNRKMCLADLGLKQGDRLMIKGTSFPLIALNPELDFMENRGIRIAQECNICFEKLMDGSTVNYYIYTCGHANSCTKCAQNYLQSKNVEKGPCPVCRS